MVVRVVILGGGFAGIYTALRLDRKHGQDVDITLINRDNFFLFTPMLVEIATGSIDTRHSVNPIRRLFRKVQFMQAEVHGVDFDARCVTVRLPTDGHREVSYDHLVIALGSVSNSFDIPGVTAHALPFKNLADAIAIRNQVIERLEVADLITPEARAPLLTWVIAGGGLSGIELTGDLNDFLRDAAGSYRSIHPEELRVVLVEASNRLLGELSSSLGDFARRKLQERGVELHLNAPVQALTSDCVTVGGVGEIHSRNVVWTAGVAPTPFVEGLGIPLEKRRIPTDECMRVRGLQNVWALGDVARIPDGRGGYHPPTAQHAVREGPRVADNIVAVSRGEQPRPFRFRGMGMLATVGRHSGVAESMGIKISGFPAWWMWRSYYLFRLPRTEKRLRVLFDWTLDLIFSRDIVELKLARSSEEEYANPRRS